MPGIADKTSPYGFSPNRDPFSFFSFDPVAKKFVERVVVVGTKLADAKRAAFCSGI